MAGSSTTSETRAPRSQNLSAERLARKRAIDREAQRSSRSKTKNYIALLESRIEALTRVQSNGNTKELVDKIEEQRKENEVLQTTLRTIGKLANSHDEGDEAPERINTVTRKSTPEDKTTALIQPKISDSGDSADDSYLLPRCDDHDDTYFGDALPRKHGDDIMEVFLGPAVKGNTNWNNPAAISLDANQYFPSIFNQPLWRTGADSICKCNKFVNFTNEVLGQFNNVRLQSTASQKIRDADIPIRAVIHGWNAVTNKYLLDSVWAALRHFDEVLHTRIAATERLVILRHLCRLLRYRMNPTQEAFDEIPLHLHERPSQRLVPHWTLVDYLVWPGLRERLVFAPHRYCCEDFSKVFLPSFRFTWAYRFHDSYYQNGKTGVYQYSEKFEEQTKDLSHFCMTPEFLNVFPELKADITSTETRPGYVLRDLSDACEYGNIGEAFGMGDLELLSAGFTGGKA